MQVSLLFIVSPVHGRSAVCLSQYHWAELCSCEQAAQLPVRSRELTKYCSILPRSRSQGESGPCLLSCWAQLQSGSDPLPMSGGGRHRPGAGHALNSPLARRTHSTQADSVGFQAREAAETVPGIRKGRRSPRLTLAAAAAGQSM